MRKPLKLIWLTPFLILGSPAHAALIDYFKDEDGSTNWQYVANFSSSVLILLLSITAITLFFSHRRARRANQELEEIRKFLEQRVKERTATLNESNRLLEGEVVQHKETMARLEESEAYIKSIVDSMPLMLIGLNKDLNITQWNNWAESTTGIRSELVIGKNLWEAYPTITLSPEQAREVLNEKKSITIKHSQRGQYYFDITLYALQSNNDTGLVVLVDDVTKQSKAENMLIQRDKMSSMGELASAMAHDINIPLQAILDNLQSVKQVASSDSHPEIDLLLQTAAGHGRQASAIVNNLLLFSRTQGDKQQLAHIPDIIDHTLELAQSVLADISGLKFNNIVIEKHYEDNLPGIPSYVSELQQVFLSLLRHACHSLGKADKENFQPKITVDVSEFYDSLWIKIQHNGRGLTTDEQQTIFEPFFQELTEEYAGELENRLSFSYFIITEHHHGHMAVTSDINVGTTFHIQLQLR